MRRWLSIRFPHMPLNRAIDVDFDDTGVTLTRRSRLRERFAWSELQRVSIRTTEDGPFDDDVFIVLTTQAMSCWVPQDVATPLLLRLQQLPGFDNESVIEAMGCTQNNEFICWQQDRSLLEPKLG